MTDYEKWNKLKGKLEEVKNSCDKNTSRQSEYLNNQFEKQIITSILEYMERLGN